MPPPGTEPNRAARPPGSRSSSLTSPPDVQARGVRGALLVPSLFVGDLVPAVCNLLHRRITTDLTGQELGQRCVESHALVLGALGNPQVEDHVRALQAVANRAQVIPRGRRAHPRLEPEAEV